MMRAALGTSGAMAMILLVACTTVHAAPLTIRIQWAGVPGHLTPLLPEAPKEIYRHYGKSYVIDPMFMAGSGPALTALAAHEIDIGGFSAQSVAIAIGQAKLDLKVIGQMLSTDVEGYSKSNFWVRTGEIKTIEDLRGKTIAVNARGGAPDAVLRATMTKRNMADGKDYQVVELRFPAMLPALESKRVDAAGLVLPYSLLAAKNPAFTPLFSGYDALGPFETVCWIAHRDWIEKNRAALVDLLEDNMRFRRWIADPKTRMDAIRLAAKVTKEPVANYEEWAFTTEDNYREPHARINVARLQKNIDDLHALGLLPMTIEAGNYVDMSLADEAAKRIGP
jgi:NitT/TauT family transport system substrate-binding protein